MQKARTAASRCLHLYKRHYSVGQAVWLWNHERMKLFALSILSLTWFWSTQVQRHRFVPSCSETKCEQTMKVDKQIFFIIFYLLSWSTRVNVNFEVTNIQTAFEGILPLPMFHSEMIWLPSSMPSGDLSLKLGEQEHAYFLQELLQDFTKDYWRFEQLMNISIDSMVDQRISYLTTRERWILWRQVKQSSTKKLTLFKRQWVKISEAKKTKQLGVKDERMII